MHEICTWGTRGTSPRLIRVILLEELLLAERTPG